MVAWHHGTKGAMERLLPDGRWLLVTERRTASGEIVGIRTDITALKGALDDLAAANERAGRATREAHAAREAAEAASEAKTEFLASMSHEIRTPLNGVLGYTDLLLDDPALTGDQRRHVRRIQTAGSALLTVVNDILDFSKIEAGQVELEPQAFPLAALVDNTVSITRTSAERKGLAFRVEMGSDLPAELVGDHDRLRQVLLNLLNNAIKFTQAGSVTLSLACAPGSTDEVCRVLFRVTDTGLGIPKDKMHRLFQRFSQVDGSVSREYGGTGLGLAISKRLVELMGGEIGVESEHLQGASFWFTAPLARVRAAPEPVDAVPAPAGAGGARVLLVEDLEINQELARAVLESAGHQVDVVGDGGDAVMAVRARAYDVVLMDVQMPGMDGITATRHIREADHPSSRIPIVAMTANVLPQQVTAFREAGMDDHVGKPFKRPELLAKVARWAARAPEPEGPGAPAGGGAGPVLDRAVYDTMRELLGGDKLDAMLERLTGDLRRRFCEGGPDPDRRRLAGDAHATISTAGMLGFTGLSELCREVETACQDGADVGPLMERLDAATRAVIAEIGTLRAAA
jgi:signal transduction histidine kinase/DNA-binding NarL/FixJ family response regulator/HPt (histidine-containing phosphotransfer) domain-containing protein